MIFPAHLQRVCFSISLKHLIRAILRLTVTLSFFLPFLLSPLHLQSLVHSHFPFKWCSFIQTLKFFPPCCLQFISRPSSLFLTAVVHISFSLPLPPLYFFSFQHSTCHPVSYHCQDAKSAATSLYFCFVLYSLAWTISSVFILFFIIYFTPILSSMPYLVSGWVFSRFSWDELFSWAWIRPEALILL